MFPTRSESSGGGVCKNGLATKENLFCRRCAPSNVCPICNSEVESIEHLLFFCSWARAVWFGCNIMFNGPCESPNSAIQWTAKIYQALNKKEATAMVSKVAFIAWNIWKSRNNFIFRNYDLKKKKFIFRNEKVNPAVVMSKANFACLEFQNACAIPTVHMENQPVIDGLSTWVAPDLMNFKANCDVALKNGDDNNRIAVGVRDDKGTPMDGLTKSPRIVSVLHGELVGHSRSMLDGLHSGFASGFSGI